MHARVMLSTLGCFICGISWLLARDSLGTRSDDNSLGTRVVVLVTGSSSGIGKSTAIEFAKDDRFKVWATMRSTDQWDAEPRDNLIVAEMDVTMEESVDAVVSRIIAVEGRIDIVVNNAGYGVAGCLEVVHLEEAKQLFDVNVWVSTLFVALIVTTHLVTARIISSQGVVRVMQSVLPYMRKQRSGHLIQVSSTVS
jgi:NAD(P)-dependent dehydrogenase (short-subunit alcohol dehydrogenase family)